MRSPKIDYYYKHNTTTLNEEKTPEYELICAIIASGVEEVDIEFLESKLCEYYCTLIGFDHQCILDRLDNLKEKDVPTVPVYVRCMRCSLCGRTRDRSRFDKDNGYRIPNRKCIDCLNGIKSTHVGRKYCFGCKEEKNNFDYFNTYEAKRRLCDDCCNDFMDARLCKQCRVIKESDEFYNDDTPDEEHELCTDCRNKPSTTYRKEVHATRRWCVACHRLRDNELFDKNNGTENRRRRCMSCIANKVFPTVRRRFHIKDSLYCSCCKITRNSKHFDKDNGDDVRTRRCIDCVAHNRKPIKRACKPNHKSYWCTACQRIASKRYFDEDNQWDNPSRKCLTCLGKPIPKKKTKYNGKPTANIHFLKTLYCCGCKRSRGGNNFTKDNGATNKKRLCIKCETNHGQRD